MPRIKFKEFGYYEGNRSNEEEVDVDQAFSDYTVGSGHAVLVEQEEIEPPAGGEDPNVPVEENVAGGGAASLL